MKLKKTLARIIRQVPVRANSRKSAGISDMIDTTEVVEFALQDLWTAPSTDRLISVDKKMATEILHRLYDRDLKYVSKNNQDLCPYVAELRNVRILPGSRVVLTENDHALSDEMTFSFCKASAQPKRNHFGMKLKEGPKLALELPKEVASPIECGIHLTCEHEHNYFHWVAEILPRLLAFEKVSSDKSTPLLISDGLHENLYRLLDLVRDPQRPIIKLEREKVYRVGQLTYPADVSRVLDDTADVSPGEFDFIPAGLLQEVSKVVKERLSIAALSSRRRLYLVRNRKYRIPSNQDEVVSCLANLRFTAVDTGVLTIEEQVRLFSEAQTIVSPTGAACTNMLWAPQGAQLLVLHSDHEKLAFPYWNALARANGIEISYLSGSRNHVRPNVHDDFVVDTNSLIDAVEN